MFEMNRQLQMVKLLLICLMFFGLSAGVSFLFDIAIEIAICVIIAILTVVTLIIELMVSISAKTTRVLNNHLIFLDLETGGLNGRLPNGELGCEYLPVLEVAIIVTDTLLNEIATFHYIIAQDDEAISRCDQWALNMHEKTGLLKRVVDARGNTNSGLSCVEQTLIDDLKSIGVEKYNKKNKTGGIVCGSSVGFDRSFMMAQMTNLNSYFHYRQIDVSTIALLCQMWRPKIETRAIKHKKFKHEALPDIRETIEELGVYKQYLFR